MLAYSTVQIKEASSDVESIAVGRRRTVESPSSDIVSRRYRRKIASTSLLRTVTQSNRIHAGLAVLFSVIDRGNSVKKKHHMTKSLPIRRYWIRVDIGCETKHSTDVLHRVTFQPTNCRPYRRIIPTRFRAGRVSSATWFLKLPAHDF